MDNGRKVGHEFDSGLIKKLGGSNEIEILLISADTSPCGEAMNTFTCSMVFLKTDKGDLFRIEGIVVEREQEEIYTIDLKTGWLEFSAVENPDGAHLVFGSEFHDFRDTKNLQRYSILYRANGIDIQSRTVHFGPKNKEGVVVNEAIVLTDGDRTIFVGQDVFPYSILITDEPSIIHEKENKYL